MMYPGIYRLGNIPTGDKLTGQNLQPFITVKTFSGSDSTSINNAISGGTLYFYPSGSLFDKNTKWSFQCPLTSNLQNNNDTQTDNNLINAVSGPWSNIKTLLLSMENVPQNIKGTFYVQPQTGGWLLYKSEKGVYSLLYNPINRNPESNVLKQGTPEYNFDLLINYCEDVGFIDPICYCSDQITSGGYDYCTDLALTTVEEAEALKNSNSLAYNTVKAKCGCISPACDYWANQGNIYAIGKTSNCNSTITICNTSFKAGNNIDANNLSISQACTAASKTSQSGPTVPPPPTLPPSGTTVPPSGTTVPPSGTTVPPSGTTVPPSGTTPTPTSKKWYETYWFYGSVGVTVFIIISVIIYLATRKSE